MEKKLSQLGITVGPSGQELDQERSRFSETNKFAAVVPTAVVALIILVVVVDVEDDQLENHPDAIKFSTKRRQRAPSID